MCVRPHSLYLFSITIHDDEFMLNTNNVKKITLRILSGQFPRILIFHEPHTDERRGWILSGGPGGGGGTVYECECVTEYGHYCHQLFRGLVYFQQSL